MKFNKYMEEFKQISGIISVGIIQDFSCPEINEDDVKTVMDQTGISEEEAKKAIEKADGDLAKVIMDHQ